VKQIKFWKKSILILTCAAVVAGGTIGLLYKDSFQQEAVVTAPQPQADWKPYTSDQRGFGVQFPAEPTESDQQMVIQGKNIAYQELSAAFKETTYAVSYIDFPKHWKWIGTNKLLTKGFDAFIQSEQEVEALLKQELTTHRGLPALEYHLKQAGKEVKGKFLIVGNTLYRITVATPLALADTAQPDAFFSSFQVNG